MKESTFQSNFIKLIEKTFPGCLVLKNDPKYKQGIPDLIILYGKHWAMTEIKRSKNATHRPNQDYWVKRLNTMSYAAFVYPENVKSIIEELKEVLT